MSRFLRSLKVVDLSAFRFEASCKFHVDVSKEAFAVPMANLDEKVETSFLMCSLEKIRHAPAEIRAGAERLGFDGFGGISTGWWWAQNRIPMFAQS
jgi:hypothetical protein